MAINDAEYKSRIGLDKLYYALVSEDSADAYTVGTPKYLAPAAEASQAITQNSETQYADDSPYDVMSSEGETAITLSVTGIPLATLAEMTGQEYDAASGIVYEHGGTPPYCALLFRSLKSSGSYRYYAFLKGRFDMPNEDAATKGETPTPQPQEIVFHAIKTTHEFQLAESVEDGVKRVVGDEDIDAFDGSTWFDAVTTPPEISSV